MDIEFFKIVCIKVLLVVILRYKISIFDLMLVIKNVLGKCVICVEYLV